MTDNLKIWNAVKQPPKEALRPIQAGRLKGKSDINPQWRYQAMTEQFGPIGIGWYPVIVKEWTEPANGGQVFAFVDILLYVKIDGEWSNGIPGTGGSMLIVQETHGLHANDEAFKMAYTDALSVAMKMLGFASDVYAGLWDGAKYVEKPTQRREAPEYKPPTSQTTNPFMDDLERQTTPSDGLEAVTPGGVKVENVGQLFKWAMDNGINRTQALKILGAGPKDDLTKINLQEAVDAILAVLRK